MAIDATGTPTTALGIPKYNTAQDIPSGKGFNAAMDFIDDLLEARTPAANPSTSGVKVWNNTTKAWDAVTGTPDGTKFLRDDGAWAAPAGGLTVIDDYTVTGAVLAMYDTDVRLGVNGIPQTYKHLKLVYEAMHDVGSAEWIYMKMNGLSTAIYYTQYMSAAAGVQSNGELLANSSGVQIGQVAGGAGLWSGGEIEMPYYRDTTRSTKQFRCDWTCAANNSTGTLRVAKSAGWAGSTAAIQRITLDSSGNFSIGSRFVLYGVG